MHQSISCENDQTAPCSRPPRRRQASRRFYVFRVHTPPGQGVYDLPINTDTLLRLFYDLERYTHRLLTDSLDLHTFTMASDYDPTESPEVSTNASEHKPQPHPCLHDPLLYISGIPVHVLDEQIAAAFSQCAPFRPRIPRDANSPTMSGTIEFRFLDAGECS